MGKIYFVVVTVFFLLLFISVKTTINSRLYADDTATSSAIMANTFDEATPSAAITSTASSSARQDTLMPATSSAQPTLDTLMSTTNTGNSIASTSITNMINTQLINSHIYYQTINVFLDTNESIDLSQPITTAETLAVTTTNPTTNILMASSTNYSVLTNTIATTADTGDNTNSGDTVIMNTGNAYASTQLINYLNVTLVNTDIHMVTINIYANMQGDIIFPTLPFADLSSCSNQSATISAAVTNNVTNIANTGNNTIAATQSGDIIAGNATSITNITNFMNTILSGQVFQTISIHTFGTWEGNLLGIDTDTKQIDASQTNMPLFIATDAAKITNRVTNTANTGNNLAAGKTSEIITGNAYADVNILNFIHTIFTDSLGYFSFINIFGNLTGDIGDAAYFVTPTPSIEGINNNFVESNIIQENTTSPMPTIFFIKNTMQSINKSSPINSQIAFQKKSVLAASKKHSVKSDSNFFKIFIALLFVVIGSFYFQKIFYRQIADK